ncbi:DUF3800 domain-containing protein [Asticcacaulis taihuensis]|uniref:DUF3800 domain-containing protein n=1 Tax=Asticcacaulis taihuensis TaxID=260084 RepID=UPI003F7C92B5
MAHSDYIVYVDESGDHSLKNVHATYPVFALAFCVFKKSDYIENVVPRFQELKFRFWGHDTVVLHEHDIRKTRDGAFLILNNPEIRTAFMTALSSVIGEAPFEIFATVVRKEKLLAKYAQPANPYELSLLFCMEELHRWLDKQPGESGKTVNLVFECRGKQEDNDLELEFRRICDNRPQCLSTGVNFKARPYEIRFVPKKANSTGLQLADLIARPIGLHCLNPIQPNRAYDGLKSKIKLLKTFP